MEQRTERITAGPWVPVAQVESPWNAEPLEPRQMKGICSNSEEWCLRILRPAGGSWPTWPWIWRQLQLPFHVCLPYTW
jgi:hypothetical protein